jgi:SAM-dependent methyltransferase
MLAFFGDAPLRPLVRTGPRVLEVGAYDVNGSVRGISASTVQPAEYIGVDLAPGPGVDVVASGHEVDFPEASFDLTLSAECLEHNPHWEATLRNMRRMTRPNGFVVVSCATLGRLEHGTARTNPASSPGTQSVGWNYYRNLVAQDFPGDFLASFAETRFWVNGYSHDLYFIGSVGQRLPDTLAGPQRFTSVRPAPSGLFTKATLEIPLAVLAKVLSERAFQEAGVALLRGRMSLKRAISPRRQA